MLPMANNGSILIYNKLIKPFVKKHEKTFEKVIDETTHLVKDAGQSGTQLKLEPIKAIVCWGVHHLG